MNKSLIPCPFCNSPILEDCIYCDICGEKLRRCTSCGAFAKSKRCTKCGNLTEDIEVHGNLSQNGGQSPGHLVGVSTQLRLGICHNAIIGRQGSFGTAFQHCLSISGLHARLLCHDGIWEIEDIGSSYGTFVNGVKLKKDCPMKIEIGDILKFANVEFKVTE